MNNPTILRKLLVTFLLLNIFAPTAEVFAQRRSTSTIASTKAPAATKCSGAWTGVITYTRRQVQSDNKTVDRVSARGKDTRNWEMKYDYQAQVAVVESPEKNGSSIGKATIDHTFTSKETVDAVENNSCDRGKTWRDMRGTTKSETETSGSATVDANVSVGVNADGTYSVSVGLPRIDGTTKGTQSSSFSGQCTPKEGKTFNMPPTPTLSTAIR
jgi:hypothetical protein